jgi:hypothetical protein
MDSSLLKSNGNVADDSSVAGNVKGFESLERKDYVSICQGITIVVKLLFRNWLSFLKTFFLVWIYFFRLFFAYLLL